MFPAYPKGGKMTKYLSKRWVAAVSLLLIAGVLVGAVRLYRDTFSPDESRYTSMKELFKSKFDKFGYNGNIIDRDVFDYPDLFDTAHTVALVTSTDTLTQNNTFNVRDDPFGRTDEKPGLYSFAYSEREVAVLQYYKNTKEYGDTLTIAEQCAMSKSGSVYVEESCYPMQKGDTYLLFLEYIPIGHGNPVTISAGNGKIDLTYLRLNYFLKIAINALYQTELLVFDNEHEDIVKALISAKDIYGLSDEPPDSFYREYIWEYVKLTTDYTKDGMETYFKYAKTDSGYLFELGAGLYESKS
jgi:hypothetical protein